MTHEKLAGIYVAALTPTQPDYAPDTAAIPPLLDFYARRGCHGALLLGTTGEGPSFSPSERVAIFRAAAAIKASHPHFRLLAGTGTPSLDESIQLTQAAFEHGFDGVVVLPPYYFRSAPESGLLRWFQLLIERAVPQGGSLLYYHIPQISGVSVSLQFFQKLQQQHPQRFAGLKDSTGDEKFGRQLGEQLGRQLAIFTGNDRLLSHSLHYQGAGCITAMANFASPQLRAVWDAHQNGRREEQAQTQLNAWRAVLEEYQPYGPALKGLMAQLFDELQPWPAQPPLIDRDQDTLATIARQLCAGAQTPTARAALRGDESETA